MKICPICGRKLLNGTTVCHCGFNFQGTSHLPSKNGSETEFIVSARKKATSDKIKKAVIFLLIIILTLSFTGIGLYRFYTVRWHKNIDPVLYLSEGVLMCTDLKRPNAKPAVIGTLDGTQESFSVHEATFISQDKKTLLFTNGFNAVDDYFTASYSLFCFDLTKPSEPAILIAEDVTSHTVNSSFDTLTLVRTNDNGSALYQSDFFGNESLICENYSSYSVSLDGDKLIYITDDDELYFKEKGEMPLLLDKNVTLISLSEDLGEIIYRTEKGEFIKFTDGEKTQLSENELPSEQVSETDSATVSSYALSDNTFAYLKSTNPHNYELPNELYINEEKILDNIYYYTHFDPHFKILVVCNIPDEGGYTTFTIINESEIISFDAPIKPEDSSISVTAQGSVVVEASSNPDSTIIFKNGAQSLSPVIADCYSVPHYPEAVINAVNYDFSELME